MDRVKQKKNDMNGAQAKRMMVLWSVRGVRVHIFLTFVHKQLKTTLIRSTFCARGKSVYLLIQMV